jgi:hypothetical protein
METIAEVQATLSSSRAYELVQELGTGTHNVLQVAIALGYDEAQG